MTPLDPLTLTLDHSLVPVTPFTGPRVKEMDRVRDSIRRSLHKTINDSEDQKKWDMLIFTKISSLEVKDLKDA